MGSLLFHCSRRPWGSPDQRRNAKELTWWYDCHRHTRPQEISAGSHDGWDGCNLTEHANGFSKKHEEKPKLLVNEGCALFEMSNEHSCEKNTVTWCINMFACKYWTLKNTFDISFNETKHICIYIYITYVFRWKHRTNTIFTSWNFFFRSSLQRLFGSDFDGRGCWLDADVKHM